MSDLLNSQIADALEKCDWAGASIGNKAIVSLAIEALRNARPAPVATPADATDEMVEAALAVDWDNEDERATVHNIWHAMTAKLTSSPAATDTGLETVAWESMDNKLDPNDKLVYEVKFPRNGDKRLVYKSQAEELLAEKDIIIRSHLTTIATLNADTAAFNELCNLTFAIQHNPNCPDKFLIRLPGKSGCIDLKPYGDQLGFRAHKTGDVIGAGATLHEACQKALARLGQVGL